MSTTPATTSATFRDFLSPTAELLEDARAGKMFILVDDEDRENEGDLIIPAQFADAAAINFMARFARGLICLALTSERVRQLNLPLMSQANGTRHETAFTVSIEAKSGVTTGISAADRARTVAVAIDPACGPADIVTPGHVFPLRARDGGTLMRAGHTEAAVDFARMAGLIPAGVICEIMNDDGTMARLPDLVAFAQHHGLKCGTIADLIAHRRRTETLVARKAEAPFSSIHGGDWRMIVYVNTVEYAEHIALVKGNVAEGGPVLVRMHAVNVLSDVLGDTHGSPGDLTAAMRTIGEAGRGVVVLIREPRPTALSERVARLAGGEPRAPELRDYGVGAQILLDLGVRDMVLLSNTRRTVIGLDGYGLSIVGHHALRPGLAPGLGE
jgi:3,4-dihydroxy 2-butanone 4-phosphate synthase/GTP cyclohydrolase II